METNNGYESLVKRLEAAERDIKEIKRALEGYGGIKNRIKMLMRDYWDKRG